MLIILQCLSLGFVAYPWWAKLPIGSVGYQEASDHSPRGNHRRLNQGRVCWKVACFPLSPLSSCLLACSGGHWFLENGKKKKNVVPKTSICGKAFFSSVCVYVCARVREHLHKHVFLKKRSVSIYVGNTCLEVRGELVELILPCCVGVGCALVGRLCTH